MRLIKNRRSVVIVAVMAAMTVAGLSFAAWLSGGSGSAYSGATTAQDLTTVDVSATTSATLYPGATGDAKIRISNPNDYPVRITTVSKDAGAIVADAGHSAGCQITGVAFADQSGLTIDVPANGEQEATLSAAVTMSNASENGCQGATFEIPVTFSGASNAS
jgi:hypothetical protein